MFKHEVDRFNSNKSLVEYQIIMFKLGVLINHIIKSFNVRWDALPLFSTNNQTG